MNRAVLRGQEGAGELRLKQRGRLHKSWCPAYFIQLFKVWENFTDKQTNSLGKTGKYCRFIHIFEIGLLDKSTYIRKIQNRTDFF